MTIHDLVIKLLEHDFQTKVLFSIDGKLSSNFSIRRTIHYGSMHIIIYLTTQEKKI